MHAAAPNGPEPAARVVAIEVGAPAESRLPWRAAAPVLAPASLVVAAAVLAQRFVRGLVALRVLDNLHWTVSYTAAAALAWIGVRHASAEDRTPRRWLAAGLTGYAIGQVLWDVQVAAGWNPFPGPSDAFYLLLGPCVTVGLVTALRARATRSAILAAAIDGAGLSIAVLILTLALYLPLRGQSSILQMSVLVAYPLGMLGAACIAALLVPTLRLRPAFGWVTFLAALWVNGAVWMEWNARTLANRLEDGTLYNASFSGLALLLGLGAMAWQPASSRDPRWERRFDAALRLLPLLVVMGASAAVIVAFTFPAVPPVVKDATAYGSVAVVTLALLRQSILLHERDRMLEAERRFRSLFDSAQDAILLMDGRRFVDCNPSAERMFGMSRDAICRSTPVGLSPERQPDGRLSSEAAPERISAALAGESQFFRWRHQRPDGSTFEAEVSLDCVELPSGRALQAAVRDVTERVDSEATRRRLEDQLRHASRLEAVGRLAGGVAHDFNNVLTVILGTTELALTRVGADPRLERDLAEIRRSAQRAASLTAQLLAFSRKQVIAPVPSDLNALIGGALVMLRRLIGEDVELAFEPGADLGTVLVDPTQVEQVLVNLAVNARDAMPDGGRLQIATAPADLDAADCAGRPGARPGRYVRLTVRDTGTGVPEPLIPHVFEPFFTTKEFGRGTGLGLATVHGIVHQSGGFIELASTPGSGACFTIHLPVREASSGAVAPVAPVAAPAPPAPAAHPRAPGRAHILLVEDEDMVRDLARRALTDLGFFVLAAASGAQAIELAADAGTRVDLLLTDVIMPTMSGRQLFEQLARQRPGLRVVYMSGYTDNVIAPHGVLEPGTPFIQKPFTLDALAAALDGALDSVARAAA
ncbi:MAG TPA: ATP-binding protein [Candidatus Acidoferrales bacterium]|nr:ATP-binding protein [Candidatus Acidoferrales bacterium]